MTLSEYRSGVPEDWFVDPVRLGVPGVRKEPSTVEGADDNPLAWQTDSLCAQTDPEAFFPEKGGSTRDAKKICGSCEVRPSACSTLSPTMNASESGADCPNASVANSASARAEPGPPIAVDRPNPGRA